MLLNQDSKFVRRSEDFEQKTYTINASAHAFKVLSDSLYTNKVAAIIRELSCNAIDSQVAAKNDVQFHIYLPTESSPEFRIRDFGTGLSHEDIYDIYTKYFESTKSNSNDFIGALGLGSKTPFCYTDNFVVQSYFNGTKRSYAAIITENGTPSISLISEEPTSEANGLEVFFAVKKNDIYLFEMNAESTFAWFEKSKLPKIFRGKSVVSNDSFISHWTKKVVSSIEVGDVSYHHTSTTSSKNSIDVVMGNVRYSLTLDQIALSSDESKEFLKIWKGGPVLVVPIGSVDVQASRENLSLNKRTVAFLKSSFREILKVIHEKANNSIVSCDSYMSACITFVDFRNKFFPAMFSFDHYNDSIDGVLWQGQKINSFIQLKDKIHSVSLGSYMRGSNRRRIRVSDSFRINFKDSFFWIGDAEKKQTIAKLVHFQMSVQPGDRDIITNSYIFPTKEAMEKVLGNVPSDMWKSIDDLPKPPREPRKVAKSGYVGKKKSQFWVMNERLSFSIGDVDTTEGGYYILKKGKSFSSGGSEFSLEVLGSVVSSIENLVGEIEEPIIAITESQKKEIENLPNWKYLSVRLKEDLEFFLKDNKESLAEEMLSQILHCCYSGRVSEINKANSEVRNLLFNIIEKSNLSSNSDEKTFVRLYKEYKENTSNSWKQISSQRYNFNGVIPGGFTIISSFETSCDKYVQDKFDDLSRKAKKLSCLKIYKILFSELDKLSPSEMENSVEILTSLV